MRVALAILLAAAFASPAFAGTRPKPKMCGVYARYACGSSAPTKKAKTRTCGVYLKYSC